MKAKQRYILLGYVLKAFPNTHIDDLYKNWEIFRFHIFREISVPSLVNHYNYEKENSVASYN